MKHLLCLFALLAFSLNSNAQHSLSLSVDFNHPAKTSSEGIISPVMDVAPFPEAPFASLSAYILESNVDVHLEFKILTAGGWSEWEHLHLNTEGETPDRTTFFAPYIEKEFEAIRFRSSQKLNRNVVFRIYFPSASGNTINKMKGAMDSACACQKPAYCGRDCWCPSGNCPKDASPDYTTPTHIIIHHSAGTSTSNNWPAVVAAIWDAHVNTNGWDDVGYNWLIDPDGLIYEGRGDSTLGAHFSCMNTNTLGICMLGNFETVQPTFSMISSLTYLIAWESCLENIPPLGSSFHAASQLNLPNISSHRDGNTSTQGCPKGTACPGANLYVLLPTIRQNVANNPCTGPLDIAQTAHEDLSIFPNPVQDELQVKWNSSFGRSVKGIEIRNTTGQTVCRESKEVYSPEGTTVETNNLARGIYILSLITDHGPVNHNFIKN
ncbi:MAG TPA: hypothetical protein DCG19_00810 [Cryomorphaceae bacterium]|nr:hypothetical protein [Owenweeksia sp.]HAD95909.1 hypothetical protein [Cryomorphaceae bacterium]HBF21584.1 hypothetical protein [Cryomorphaceae bacterium]|tara:strand:- start:7551 stop:8858 length:1308 start_codon:yes stop_codon:yes gene_type:complete